MTSGREQEGFEATAIPPVATAIIRRAATVVGVALALTLGGCSSSSRPGASSITDTGAPKTTVALLQRALQEQIAGNTNEGNAEVQIAVSLDSSRRSKGIREGARLAAQ